MRNSVRFTSLACALGVLIGLQALAGQALSTHVEFAPQLAQQFVRRYGPEQQQILASAITAAVSRASRSVPIASALVVTILVEDAAPSHPTRQQISDNASLDATRTHYLGGAQLSGDVRDVSGRTVATVQFRHFAPTVTEGSISADPWADARIAIDEFAAKLVAACRDRSGHTEPPASGSSSH